jgi:hypothetical protein
LGRELVDVGYDVVLIKYAYHSGPIDKRFCYALCVYLLHAKLPNQEYIQHGHWQFAGAKLTAELRKEWWRQEGFPVEYYFLLFVVSMLDASEKGSGSQNLALAGQ